MIRKSILTVAGAAVISAAAMGATASTASAGFKVYLGHGYGHGYGYDHRYYGHGYYNPCKRFLRRYHRSGRYKFLRKYRRCMRFHY